MEKKYYLISGLPRSGSTLLSNILNENPKSYSSTTSGIFEIYKPIKNGFNKINEFKSYCLDNGENNILKGIFESYYKNINKNYIFDKNRGWPSQIESLKLCFNENIKVIACVREIKAILISWEKMYRRDKNIGKNFPDELIKPDVFINKESRFENWASKDSILGKAYLILKDAIDRGNTKNIYFFEYEKWTNEPEKEFKKLYEWLDIEYFQHDFANVKQVLNERDEYHGFNDLHTIKEGKIIPSLIDYREYMSKKEEEKYSNLEFWKG